MQVGSNPFAFRIHLIDEAGQPYPMICVIDQTGVKHVDPERYQIENLKETMPDEWSRRRAGGSAWTKAWRT